MLGFLLSPSYKKNKDIIYLELLQKIASFSTNK